MVNFVLHIFSIGRAFILRGKEEIKTELEGIMKSNDTDIQEYEVTNIKNTIFIFKLIDAKIIPFKHIFLNSKCNIFLSN